MLRLLLAMGVMAAAGCVAGSGTASSGGSSSGSAVPPECTVTGGTAASPSGAPRPADVDGGLPYGDPVLLAGVSMGGGLHIDVRSNPQPPVRGTNGLQFVIHDGNGQPLDGVQFTHRPWMPVHNHGTSITPTIVARGAGVYEVQNVYLYMDGTWELQTTFSAPMTDSFIVTCVIAG